MSRGAGELQSPVKALAAYETRANVRLGIDFGTTRTVIAAVDRGNYPLLSFERPEGGQLDWIPSLIAVRGAERLYGWDAWACQAKPDWTVIRSLKRVLQDAGPNTILELGDQSVPLIQVLREMAAALRSLLPHEKLEVMLGVRRTPTTTSAS